MNCTVKDTCKLFDGNTCVYDTKFCMRKFKIEYLLSQTLLTDFQLNDTKLYADVEDEGSYNFLSEIKTDIVSFVNQGNNLYIYSRYPGNGKTSWSIKLLKSYIYRIWPESKLVCKALFINVPKFLLALKANISNKSDYIEYINEHFYDTDIVIWDDIGTKAATEFEHEHLLSMLDYRLINNKSNIFTSNVVPEELGLLVGDRLASRIINTSEKVEFKGKDKRGIKLV